MRLSLSVGGIGDVALSSAASESALASFPDAEIPSLSANSVYAGDSMIRCSFLVSRPPPVCFCFAIETARCLAFCLTFLNLFL